MSSHSTFSASRSVPPDFTVEVPATSANLGSGFDALGVALSLRNRFHFSVLQGGLSSFSHATGEGAEILNGCGGSCMILQAMAFAAERLGGTLPPIGVHIESHIPVQRGLGSSASAVVAGVVAADRLLGTRASDDELLTLCAALECHADNVAPALRGGFQTALFDGKAACSLRIPLPAAFQESLRLVVCVPDFRVSTGSSRNALPASVPHRDAAFNVGRASLLTVALCSGAADMLRFAVEDRLHQPYRADLVPGFQQVIAAAEQSGAYGAMLSGSGSTMLALSPASAAEHIGASMQQAFERVGHRARWWSLTVAERGTVVDVAPDR